MIFHRNYFLGTTDKIDVLSIIHEINRAIRESKATNGLAIIMVPAPGAAVTIIEPLPEVIETLKEAIRIFPGESAKTKNRKKEDIAIGPRVAAAMLGKTISLPISEGRLAIGLREEPVLIDLETKGKRREFFVHIFGEGGDEQQQQGRTPPQMRKGR